MTENTFSEAVETTTVTLYKYNTEFNADSVEWCPHKPNQNFFVCANYQLILDTQKRIGRILLFSISPDSGLKLWQTLHTAAVLDQKWCHNQINHFSILAVVNAEHTIEIYKFNTTEHQLELLTFCSLSDITSETLLLSLDWATAKLGVPEIICSDSKGYWHKYRFDDSKVQHVSSYQAHGFESWIAAFYYWDTNTFYTGGDDCLLLKFDTRTGLEPILKNKQHEAGVTSIHSNAEKEFLLATGSYDENIRLWDVRNMKTPSYCRKMPGPVWRLKWDPLSFNYLLSACMLGGAHVLSERLEIVHSYCEHQSMTYGADWSFLEGCERVIATCSFYDSLLCICKFDL